MSNMSQYLETYKTNNKLRVERIEIVESYLFDFKELFDLFLIHLT